MRNKGPAFSGARGRGWKIYRGGRRKVAVRKKIEEEGRKDGRRRKKETGVVPPPLPTVGRRAGNNADGITRVAAGWVEAWGGGSCVSGSTRARKKGRKIEEN